MHGFSKDTMAKAGQENCKNFDKVTLQRTYLLSSPFCRYSSCHLFHLSLLLTHLIGTIPARPTRSYL